MKPFISPKKHNPHEIKNPQKPTAIIGQSTEDISQAIEAAALKNLSFPFVFARAGNTKAYNKSQGKKKRNE